MLYFVATPIGNLKDISYRAVETLKNVDIIACEDTRNSLKLLLHYDIKKELISYHKFNEKNSSEGIIKLLKQGKNIAVISDSGMPIISDPGSVLVERLIEEKLEYTVVPGANAGLSALLLSGFDAKKFTFVGFLPENKERKQLLEEISKYFTTLIFYVSPHSLKKDIEDIYKYLGNRKACLVNEITKMYEKTIFFNLQDNLETLEKGEFVLVVEKQEKTSDFTSFSIDEHIAYYIEQGIDKKEAIKLVAKDRKIAKSEIYKTTIDKN